MQDVVLQAFATLFVVIDPVGMLPLFLGLTAGMDRAERRRLALKGTLIAALVLLAFALAGDPLLALLGIGLPAFRIAGGLMLLSIASEMVFERRNDRRGRSARELAAEHRPPTDDIAVFPLAIPLLSGPGAITSMLLLMGHHAGDGHAQAAVIGVMVLVLGLCALVFLLAEPLEQLIGMTLTAVISRLLGIILAALAVQHILDGVITAWRAAAV
jgi:multiple antibiotic resistance protein